MFTFGNKKEEIPSCVELMIADVLFYHVSHRLTILPWNGNLASQSSASPLCKNRAIYCLIIHSCLAAFISACKMMVNPIAALRCFAGLTIILWQIPCDQAGMTYPAPSGALFKATPDGVVSLLCGQISSYQIFQPFHAVLFHPRNLCADPFFIYSRHMTSS